MNFAFSWLQAIACMAALWVVASREPFVAYLFGLFVGCWAGVANRHVVRMETEQTPIAIRSAIHVSVMLMILLFTFVSVGSWGLLLSVGKEGWTIAVGHFLESVYIALLVWGLWRVFWFSASFRIEEA